MAFDKTRKLDVTSSLNPNQARKWLSEVLNSCGVRVVSLSRHCRMEMQNDRLIPEDIYQVLRDGKIYDFPEFEKGSFRYRVETERICVIVLFEEPNFIWCITTWRKR